MRRKVRLAAAAAVLLAAAFGLWRAGALDVLTGWIAPLPAVGGPFALEDTHGRPVTEKDLAGKPFALLFGFTRCPEACPATLERAGRWLAALGPEGDRMRFVLVTVDPARDTGAVLEDYLASFDPRILALRGSEAETRRLLRAYRARLGRVETGGGAYTLDHTTAVFLMDRASRLVSLIGYDEADDSALLKLRGLLAQDAAR